MLTRLPSRRACSSFHLGPSIRCSLPLLQHERTIFLFFVLFLRPAGPCASVRPGWPGRPRPDALDGSALHPAEAQVRKLLQQLVRGLRHGRPCLFPTGRSVLASSQGKGKGQVGRLWQLLLFFLELQRSFRRFLLLLSLFLLFFLLCAKLGAFFRRAIGGQTATTAARALRRLRSAVSGVPRLRAVSCQGARPGAGDHRRAADEPFPLPVRGDWPIKPTGSGWEPPFPLPNGRQGRQHLKSSTLLLS